MSVKRYSSPCVKFTVNVKLAGKQIQVVFDRYNQETKRRYVDISNGEIQQLMEQCPDYNVYFRCEFSIEDPANVPPDVMIPEQLKAEEIKDPEKVKTFLTNADAKLWINENFKVPYARITNKERLVHEYALVGYELKFETV